MQAVVCNAFGPPQNLVVESVPTPALQADQVLIQVKAAGVNYPDVLIIEGRYQYRPQLPFSPGCEVAGTVAALGAEVSGFDLGQPVVAFPGWGGFAEKVAVTADRVVKLPAHWKVDWNIAAGFLLTYGTAHHALLDRGRLQPGETVLVLGAAGGVGLAAIEIARLHGARVIAAASSRSKLDLCLARGAEASIDYTAEDLKTRAKALSDNGAGVDLVFDPVGGELAEAALRATGWRGRYLVIGFASGKIPRPPLNLALLKGCELVGVFWGAYCEREPQRSQHDMAELVDWLAAGRLKPHIDAVLPLAQASEALIRLAERRVQGKLVLTID